MLIRLKKEFVANKITTANDIYSVLSSILYFKHRFDQDKEHFYVVLISRSNMIKFVDEVSIGTLHSTLVSPREVFRFAILKGASAIIVAHNHPSGNLQPSQEDLKVISKLVSAGEILEIKVLDSIIFSRQGFLSFANEGILEQSEI